MNETSILDYFDTVCDQEDSDITIETNKAKEKLDIFFRNTTTSFWKRNEVYVKYGKVEDWRLNVVSFNYSDNDLIPVNLEKYCEVKPKKDISKINTILELFKLHLKNKKQLHYEDSDYFSNEYECIEFEKETNRHINAICS